eukprot:PITA_35371
MNIRGLGAGPKYLALKHIFYSARPKIILIQETMHDRLSSISYFRKMFPSWYMMAIDACGHSGGLAVLWNPLWIRTNAYKCFAGIMISATFWGHRLPINVLNTYAPYLHRYPFWDRFFSSDLCEIRSLMIVGDMNFTLCPDEVWGGGKKMDPLADFLRNHLLNRNLIDVAPSVLTHSWDNGRTGSAYIAKRIDRVIIHADILDSMGMPYLSIGNDSISDHRPIYIQWRHRLYKQRYPFKFDRTFLDDPALLLIVTDAWSASVFNLSSSPPSFRERMSFVRSKVKSWQLDKRRRDRLSLQKIQCELDHIYSSIDPNSLSFGTRCHIAELSRLKLQFLKQEESSWQLKSRALWLKEGDRNTKFFHKFANHRREMNVIWRICDGKGGYFYTHQDITDAALNHFKKQYSRGKGSAIHDILWGIELFPSMFDDAINDSIFQPITEDELHGILKAFSKDKCPGPDGWTIEFFIHFFDIIKHDLIQMIEESRISGRIHPHTSSTLIALIPKKRDADSFSDFRPISLCNISFKIISKIMVERIKGTLASHLSKDQHAFLKGCNILDVVAYTQECIFSMFSKNIDAVVLKIDLQKAYDCIDWGFIRCLLAKIGLRSEMINWIMACIEKVNYAININGIPSPYFHAERGLRQGCPLAPIIFILAMNTLSLHICKAVDEHRCIPIKISRHISLSHNLFVDDVLLCAMLQQSSWDCLFDILNNFQKATGLVINKSKSILYYNGAYMDLINRIAAMFGVLTCPIQNGITYLGFQLKTNNYSAKDWEWLIERFYKKISSWEFRTLSLAGRVILALAVLSQLSVYWAHMFYLPSSIIQRLNKITANFIWGGSTVHKKNPPRKNEGYIITQTAWRMGYQGSSAFWLRAIMPHLVERHFRLQPMEQSNPTEIHEGSVLIGIDPIICDHGDLHIPMDLTTHLQRHGIFTWNKLITEWRGSTPIWKDGTALNLLDILDGNWISIKDTLSQGGFHRHGPVDHLIWTVCKNRRPVSIRDIYTHMISYRSPNSQSTFPYVFWKARCPLKYIHFAWLVFHNKNLTWDNLRKRSWHGPSRCSMCESNEETNLHMFFKCPSILRIWYVLENSFDFPLTVFDSSRAALFWWSRQNGNRRFPILIFLWTAWKWRNSRIFNDSNSPVSFILDNILATWYMIYGSD